MRNTSISKELKTTCPTLRLGCIAADVVNDKFNPALWDEINHCIKNIRNNFSTETIKLHPVIEAARAAYKSTGKEPSRYRLSAEALHRRILLDKDLYQISTLVDVINFLSLSTGYSIGGFDASKIEGDVVMGIGEKDEPYAAIGRGNLNIHLMPVLRDSLGAFGSATSDSERTMIRLETKQFFMVFVDFGGAKELEPTMDKAKDLLKKYVSATNIESYVVD